METAVTEKKTEKREVKRHHFDFPFFIVLMLISAFGLVMLFSASYYYAQTKYGDGTYFLKRQLVFFAVGLAALLVLSFIDYRYYRKLALPGYIGVCVVLILTLIPGIGVKINEARRWINIAGFQFQPSEIAKFALVIALSAAICSKKLVMQSFIQGVIPCLLILAPIAGLIVLQPNFSMVIILAAVTYVMLYLGGVRMSHRFLLVVVGVILGILVLYLKSYRSNRISAWWNPEADPTGSSYQAIQSRIALGNGGLFGQGLNFSRQKLNFLPERENDYILAIIGEELGFVGCLALISGYAFLVWRGITIALRCRDRFGRLLAGGVISVLAIQVLINVGVVTSAIPSTGQTLPFVSYGGTSLMVFLAAMGILLNISRYTEVETENADRAENKTGG
ncbi:MAG: putative lipid II flippase FtsW [Clostridia bacterium]|jgi:cell division protein FtsW|nr:putative lipid II flippase FtsW [Clostridia bacterium]MBQ7060306.1 putative lipid II flippase FtsW [Clostridia bacterium]